MKLSVITNEHVLERETHITVYNWAFARGLQPLAYDFRTDTWMMTDGEPYTTTLILREAAK
jgi:hypothetical protein